MKTLFIPVAALTLLCGCGTWHYQGAIRIAREDAPDVLKEPSVASGIMWPRARTARPDQP